MGPDDTETTALDGLVCEIGVIAGDGSILFHSLVNPERLVSSAARDIHGISDEELAAAPTLPHIWPQLRQALRDRATLVAYNVDFDRAHLAQSARWKLTPHTVGTGRTTMATIPGFPWRVATAQ